MPRKHSLYHITHHGKEDQEYLSFPGSPIHPCCGMLGSSSLSCLTRYGSVSQVAQGSTLQPLWSCVRGTASAKSAEPAGRVGGWCGFIWLWKQVRSVSCQVHADTEQVGPQPVLQGISTCCIKAVLAVRRSALLLDVQGGCSPMLCGGKGLELAPTCTLLAWAELTWSCAVSDCTDVPCNSLAQPSRQYLEKRSLAASCDTIVCNI